jgi:hypothetical protein
MLELNTPLVQDNWILQVYLNSMIPSSQCVWDAILKTKFSTSESTKIRHFEIENSKNFTGRGTASSPDSSLSGEGTPLPLGTFGASILAPSALITVSRLFSQNSWQPYCCYHPININFHRKKLRSCLFIIHPLELHYFHYFLQFPYAGLEKMS